MATKSVQQVLPPVPPHMVGDGFRVHNFFPGGYKMGQKRMSPFYMLDYNAKIDFSARDVPRGVDVHPHRGFETVTIAYHGRIAHHDSFGNSGVIGEGEVQWMTAASGLLHKEYHEETYSREGGPFQMVQLWVNLPAKDKSSTPKYQAISREMLRRVPLPAAAGEVEIIAGSYGGNKGPAETFTPIEMYNVRLRKNATANLDLPAGYNTGMLIIEGSVVVNGKDTAPVDHFVLFENDGETISLEAPEDAIILVLSGEPIDEPIAAYGPFLMNTHEELEQALQDMRTGKFGRL
ncbi:MAG: pirin family protein [Sphingobacteriales bacterium]|nr:MAG: pirin family protein [Sphingobacteriales bacterium]